MTKEKIEQWYKGPTTDARIAELRFKLATARGMLERLRQVGLNDEEESAIRDALDETADP